MTVVLEGYIKVPLGELDAIQDNLDVHIQNTLNESGCLEFTVKQDIIDKCVFHVFERFKDDNAFNLHQARVKESYWGSITENVKRVYKKHSDT